MARKKLLKKASAKTEEKKKKAEEKDPYDEALEILQKYEEGNPPRLSEPED